MTTTKKKKNKDKEKKEGKDVFTHKAILRVNTHEQKLTSYIIVKQNV